MDTDEWEFLSDDGFPDFNEDSEKRKFLGKRNLEPKSASVKSDHDTGSHVFLNIKENEFVDPKLISPGGEAMEIITSPRMKIGKHMLSAMGSDEKEDSNWEEGNTEGFNLWKLSLTRVGAICSFGVAAATICFLFFGSHQKRNKLQIYTDDKD